MSIDARTCPVCRGYGSVVTGNLECPEVTCSTCAGYRMVLPAFPGYALASAPAPAPTADFCPQSEWLGILAADAESRATLLVEALESGKALDREPKLLALDLHAAASLLVEALS